MNPSGAADKAAERLHQDEAVASYVSAMKRSRSQYALAPDEARRIVDESMPCSLTGLLYKSREDGRA